MAFYDRFVSLVKNTAESAYEATHDEAAILHRFKSEALQQAKQTALHEHRLPTLKDYRVAAETMGQTRAAEMEKQGIQWSPKIYADLSGQTLDGFLIQEKHTPASTITHTADAHDRDGNGQIELLPVNEFYTNIRLDGATVKNGIVDPATSFNDEIAKAAKIENMTFNHLRDGDHFTFGAGHYHKIAMTDVDGGDMIFNASHVDGLDLSKAKRVASITLNDRATVQHLDASGVQIVSLTASPGVEISHSKFAHTTLDMAKSLEKTTWRDIDFDHTNLGHVNLRGAQLSKIRMEGCDLHGTNFNGAVIRDMTVDGVLITSAKQLEALGASADGVQIAVSPEMRLQHDLGQIRHVMGEAMKGLNHPQAASLPSLAGLGLSGGDHTDLGHVGAQDLSKVATSMPVDRGVAPGLSRTGSHG